MRVERWNGIVLCDHFRRYSSQRFSFGHYFPRMLAAVVTMGLASGLQHINRNLMGSSRGSFCDIDKRVGERDTAMVAFVPLSLFVLCGVQV